MNAIDNQPVIVGIGQHTWREPDIARTPCDALVEAASAALSDTGCKAIGGAIDTICQVRFIADTDPGVGALFPRQPGLAVASRLGIDGASQYFGPIGGNSPQYLVNHFSARLAAGDCGAVILCGAETMATFFNALRSGGDLSGWADTPAEEPESIGREREGLTRQERAHGLYEPINTYPLFENSLCHHLGHDRQAHDALIAEISHRMSAVAGNNPLAWRANEMSAEEIATVTPRNRYIGYPYTRAMNAVLEVDMAAAVVLTTVGRARELGIDEERWIYLRGGIDLDDIWYPIERADLHSSPAIRLAWETLAETAKLPLDSLTHFDIYSCFPSAVEIACDAIGLSPLDPRGVTVTGGLPFFGGPGNNYSLHAIAEMVSSLRGAGSGNGLVTANGLYLTKHSLGLYSTEPPETPLTQPDPAPLQAAIEDGPRVTPAADPAGDAVVETWTVGFDREGPKRGIIIARNAAGERIVANTPDNADTLGALLADDPIGQRGRVRREGERNIIEF